MIEPADFRIDTDKLIVGASEPQRTSVLTLGA